MQNRIHRGFDSSALLLAIFAGVLAAAAPSSAASSRSKSSTPPATAPAAEHTPPAMLHPVPCDGPEYHQFDFWIGDWNVYTPDGQLAGTNKVERILGGCAIQENWEGAKGVKGRSLNSYSSDDKQWHQTWVDEQGTRLELSGTFAEGKMVLEGDTAGEHGAVTKNRITWQRMSDGRVQQHWEISGDGGEKWTDVFTGMYTRKPR